MHVTKEEVRRIARLARLEYPRVRGDDGAWTEPTELLLDEATLDKLAADLNQILAYVRELESVDITGVEPTSHGVPLPTAFRSDEPVEGFEVERALSGAPQRVGDAISVPRIVE